MIHPPYWDPLTFVFYYLIGSVCAILIGFHFGNIRLGEKENRNILSAYFVGSKWKGYIPMMVLLILFACLRKIGQGIGGTDSISYENEFLNSLNDLGTFEDKDILFGRYILLLRHLTSSPFVFRLASYSFIAFSICYFVKEICPEKVSCIPFILVVWPYLCGFSSMRSTMAIGFILFAIIALYKKKYIWEWTFLIASVMFHRMMFFLIPIFVIFNPVYNLIIKCNKYQIMLLLSVSIIVISLMALSVQKYILLFGLLDSNSGPDASYISKSLNMNLFESWPMFIQQLFLMIFLFISFRNFNTRKERFVLVLSCFDIVITFPALILGIFRISQCLFIPTIMLWGVLLYNFYHKFKENIRPIIGLLFLLGFSFILYKRIDSIYETSSLMPYMFFWEGM